MSLHHTFSPVLKGLGRNVMPVGLRRALGTAVESTTDVRHRPSPGLAEEASVETVPWYLSAIQGPYDPDQ